MATKIESTASRLPVRFNLKTLLLLTAAVAIILAPAKWFGGLYLFSVAFSLGLICACCYAYRNQSRGITLGTAILGLIVSFPMGFLVNLAHAFLNLLLSAVLLSIHVRPKTFVRATIGLTLVLYGLVLWNGVAAIRELEALKDKYPFVSLVARLAFERSPHSPAEKPVAQLQLTPTVAGHLDELDDSQSRSHYFSRSWALRQLHENMTMQFAIAAGFGPARMPMLLSPRYVELPPRKKLVLPARLNISTAKPTESDLYPEHRAAVLDFLDPNRMGYVRSREAAAGFESHGFSKLMDQWADITNGTASWQVVRLELVSLLRHQEPRVYVAESLPQMDQLAEVPHRALNVFEASALSKLETAEDLVIDQQPLRIQMLGALRAGTDCLECHEGQRGKLLGAFSYEITPLINVAPATN